MKPLIDNLLLQFYEYHHKRTVLKTKPQITSIEITNDCNLNCEICARDQVKAHRGIGYMSLADFTFIIEKYRPAHPRLFLHGEPTLHPNLVQMTSICRTNGAESVGFTTNGVLMTPDLFSKLALAGLTVAAFSYEGSLKHLKENCRINALLGYPVKISLNIVDSKKNHPHIKAITEYWNQVDGFSHVSVAQLGDWGGVHDTSCLESSKPYPRQTPLKTCPAPWFITVIYYNGDISPCCVWLSEPFGNIFTENLEEVWNSPEYVKFRETMLKGRTHHPHCMNCRANPFEKGSPYLTPQNEWFPFTNQAFDTFVKKPLRRRLCSFLV